MSKNSKLLIFTHFLSTQTEDKHTHTQIERAIPYYNHRILFKEELHNLRATSIPKMRPQKGKKKKNYERRY